MKYVFTGCSLHLGSFAAVGIKKEIQGNAGLFALISGGLFHLLPFISLRNTLATYIQYNHSLFLWRLLNKIADMLLISLAEIVFFAGLFNFLFTAYPIVLPFIPTCCRLSTC